MKNYKAVCADCACLIQKNGEWCCDECFGQRCEDLDECPEGVEVEEIAEIEKTAKENKPKEHVMSEKKERKPRPPREPDADKVFLISKFAEMIQNIDVKNIEIANKTKEITFIFGENDDEYSLNLIKHRKKKK